MGKERDKNIMSRGIRQRRSGSPDFTSKLLSDTAENRIKWFQEALEALLQQLEGENVTRVLFPFRIGCGAAGGSWYQHYLPAIIKFSRKASKRGINTLIVKPED